MKVESLKKFVGPMIAALMMVGCGQQSSSNNGPQVTASDVVGGTSVAEEAFRNVVGLSQDGRIFCSGNLIESNKILTAGHCITDFDIDSKEDLLAILNKTIVEVEKEDMSVFNNGSLETKRAIFKAALRRVIKAQGQAIKIYIGSSKAGGAEAGLDVVAEAELSPGGYAYMEASVLKHTIFAIPEDKAVEYSASIDYAYLTLKATLKGVTPVPVISAQEHADNVRLGQDVRVVGFGLKVDARFIIASRQKMKELTEKIAVEEDAQKKSELQIKLAQEKAMYQVFLALYITSGNKNMVDLKLENYDQREITLTKKGDRLEGACSGDSGGPALVKLKNGQWRQLGVVVTVDYCGNKTNVSPNFR